jgi:hypothetical protein
MNLKRIYNFSLFSHSACVLRFVPNCRSCAVSCRLPFSRSIFGQVVIFRHAFWMNAAAPPSLLLPQVAKITLQPILYEMRYDGESTPLNSRQTPIGFAFTADRILKVDYLIHSRSNSKSRFDTNLCPRGGKTKMVSVDVVIKYLE